jgi:cytochrome c biogenesis protein CcmG/thiol:disulfide interchange protein DsbE
MKGRGRDAGRVALVGRRGLWLACWALILLAGGPIPGWSQHAGHAAQTASPAAGLVAAPFELKTLDGQAIGLQTFRGRPLVMNFFASWCDPCRDEMPLINDLALRGSREGFSVLGVAVDDGRAAVTQYAREANLAFPIALDLNSRVKRAYRIFGPPATFFIDAQGVIQEVIIGPITAERARAALEKARARR